MHGGKQFPKAYYTALQITINENGCPYQAAIRRF